MNINPDVSIGDIVAVAAPVVGAIALWATFRERVGQLWTRSAEQERQHEENQKRFTSLELQMERDFVKKNDLAAVEERLGKRMDTALHDLKGVMTQFIAALAIRPRPAKDTE